MSNKTLIIGAFVIVAGLLISSSIYNRKEGIVTSSNNIHTGTANIVNTANADEAPDFVLEKLGGGTISLAEFKGVKPVVLDFWASWCPNCRRDMPNLNRFYDKYKDKVEVIGINLKESEKTVEKFISSNDISFPIAFDPRSQASRLYDIRYTNTHILIDKEGNIVRIVPGDISESDIISLIQDTQEQN